MALISRPVRRARSQAEHRRAADLSGGMKRRLCLAAALASDPAVVFLDEPSAGLDPYTRRQMWEVLDRARAGRLLVLTTHAMEEAELLSSRIAIMARGRVQCVGSQGYLRRRFGGGYTLVVGHLPGREESADRAVRAALPAAARLPGHFQGAASYHLPSECSVAEVFSQMERLASATASASGGAESAAIGSCGGNSGEPDGALFPASSSSAAPPCGGGDRAIADWGLSRVGLDEVFRRIVAATEPGGGRREASGDGESSDAEGDDD